jgi:single-strand DNA-binding protein
MNNVTLIGRLTRDIDLRTVGTKETSVIRNTLAVRRDKENSDFVPIVIWGKAAETVSNYCAKGSLLGVEGSIRTGSYDNKDGQKVYTTEVHSMRIHLIGSNNSNQNNNVNSNEFEGFAEPIDDGEIPF